MCEYLSLFLLRLGLLRHLGILHILPLDPCLDLIHDIVVVAHILLDDMCVHIEIQHSISEGVEEFGIMRNHDYRILGALQKCFKVIDPFFVEIVRRLVKKQDVRILDEGRREKQARLLPSRECLHDPLERCSQIHRIQYFRYLPIDVEHGLVREIPIEERLDGQLLIVLLHHLESGRHGELLIDMDAPALRLQHSGDELEDSTLPGSILSHYRDFRALSH